MLKSLFETSDPEGNGYIMIDDLPDLLLKLGKNEGIIIYFYFLYLTFFKIDR
jgi:hypothetical protein